MATHTFLWHDYETFGLNTRRERPAQFAGIRTDADLNEIGDPIELYCQPSLDYLPDPASVWLTGITPQRCMERGLPEPEFARHIEAALGATGTIGVGYNTLRFDDEVTRHLLWRNLLDPYSREWRNQCGRWDILDLVRAAYALRPEGMVWPVHQSGEQAGKPSFKLEHLSAANGLAHEAAHDAVSDVRATIALARLIKTRQPKLFDYYLALHKKDRVATELKLPTTQQHAQPFIHVSGMFPTERGCLAIMWPLASHPGNKNELIAWDLREDPSVLADLKADAIRQRIFSKQDDLPPGVTRLPIKTVHLNKSPFVLGKLATITPALAAKWGIDSSLCMAHAAKAQALPDLSAVWPAVFERPRAAVTAGQAQSPSHDVDEALYDGFVGDADRRRLEQLRRLSPEQLANQTPAFDDPRLDELCWRYRCRNAFAHLSAETQAEWLAHCRSRLLGDEGGQTPATARTLADYTQAIAALEARANEVVTTNPAGQTLQHHEQQARQNTLLLDLKAYGQHIQVALHQAH
jgi:exodeoxyribonuclease I